MRHAPVSLGRRVIVGVERLPPLYQVTAGQGERRQGEDKSVPTRATPEIKVRRLVLPR